LAGEVLIAVPAIKDCSIFQVDRSRVEEAGRRAGSVLRVHEALEVRPIQSLPAVRKATGLSFPAVIARELTGNRRNRPSVYDRCLDILPSVPSLTSCCDEL